MRRIRTPLVTAVATVLLAGSAVGAAAQEAERAAPVEVTGTDVEETCPKGPYEMVGRIEKNRGYVCLHTWSTSDPRLEGTFTRAWNLDFYRDETGLNLGYATGRLENADGAWQQRPGLRGGIAGDPNSLFEDAEWLVFDGEDAYDGLVAAVLLVKREDGLPLDPATLHGYIVETVYPPPDFLAE